MLQVETINQLMAEVGPVADLLVVDFHPTEGMWHIAVDKDVELFVEMAPSRGVLVVTGQVGTPTGDDHKALHELILRYAHAWEATEGLRISLDAVDGALWLLFDCAPQAMSAADLGSLLTAFAGRLRSWRETLATGAHSLGEPHRLESLLEPTDLPGRVLPIEHLEQLMTDVAPVADLVAVDTYPSEGIWHIAIDQETEVFVEMAPSRGVLVVTGEVGKPFGGDLKALYELFLRYGQAWAASEGMRMSLGAPDDGIWLMFDCAATQDMTATDLGRLLITFASKLRAWREIVATHAQLPVEPRRLDALLEPHVLHG